MRTVKLHQSRSESSLSQVTVPWAGIAIRRMLTGNGSCRRPSVFKEVLGAIEHRRTLAGEWAYARRCGKDENDVRVSTPDAPRIV